MGNIYAMAQTPDGRLWLGGEFGLFRFDGVRSIAWQPVYVLRRKRGTNVFRPNSPEHPDDESFPGLLLLRPEGPIFFANAAQIAHKIEPLVREAQPKIVAVDASGVLDMEYTAVKMFAQLAKRQS